MVKISTAAEEKSHADIPHNFYLATFINTVHSCDISLPVPWVYHLIGDHNGEMLGASLQMSIYSLSTPLDWLGMTRRGYCCRLSHLHGAVLAVGVVKQAEYGVMACARLWFGGGSAWIVTSLYHGVRKGGFQRLF